MTVARRPSPTEKTPPRTVFESDDLRTDEHGRYLHTLEPPEPGLYDVEVRTVVAGRQLTARTVFVVSDERPEMREVISSSRLLSAVAEATGGSHHSLAERDVPLRFNAPRVSDVTSRRYHERWNTPAVFLAVLLLLSLEWWLRRKSGFL